jgi:hypothetical protein
MNSPFIGREGAKVGLNDAVEGLRTHLHLNGIDYLLREPFRPIMPPDLYVVMR